MKEKTLIRSFYAQKWGAWYSRVQTINDTIRKNIKIANIYQIPHILRQALQNFTNEKCPPAYIELTIEIKKKHPILTLQRYEYYFNFNNATFCLIYFYTSTMSIAFYKISRKFDCGINIKEIDETAQIALDIINSTNNQ